MELKNAKKVSKRRNLCVNGQKTGPGHNIFVSFIEIKRNCIIFKRHSEKIHLSLHHKSENFCQEAEFDVLNLQKSGYLSRKKGLIYYKYLMVLFLLWKM